MMVYFSELATAFMTALVLENLLFTRAIDIPSLYEKRTPGQIILIGSVLTGIIAVCSIPSYFLNRFLGSQSSLSRFLTLGLLILNILVFDGFVFNHNEALLYEWVEEFEPALFARIGDALPFYGVNCVTLGTLMIASRISDSSKFFSFFGYCVGAGVSFTAALLLLWSVRQRLALTRVPKAFRGLPITLLSLGIISLALFGLLGNQLPA